MKYKLLITFRFLLIVMFSYTLIHKLFDMETFMDTLKKSTIIEDNQIELISEYTIQEYLIRYLMKPSPIILVDLPDGLSINNISNKTECSLHELLHRPVLQKAVQLALASRSTQTNNNN